MQNKPKTQLTAVTSAPETEPTPIVITAPGICKYTLGIRIIAVQITHPRLEAKTLGVFGLN